jgi:hypothetical protein
MTRREKRHLRRVLRIWLKLIKEEFNHGTRTFA